MDTTERKLTPSGVVARSVLRPHKGERVTLETRGGKALSGRIGLFQVGLNGIFLSDVRFSGRSRTLPFFYLEYDDIKAILEFSS